MKFAFADTPYLGYGHKNNSEYHYGDLHPEAGEYDKVETQVALVGRLVAEFPDGWALSLSSPSLKDILPACPRDCRVGAWVKPFAVFKPNVSPAYAWEPVIFCGGRKRARSERTVRDWLSCNITLRRGFPGAKPEAFCWWLFDFLGAEPDDEFHDLFPGSGAVTRAWGSYRRAAHVHPLFVDAGPSQPREGNA